MIGLSVLLAVIAYLGLARFVARRVENRAAKYAVIAVFVLIPTWDVILGRLYFYSLCEIEGGQKIHKTIEISKEFYGPNVPNAKAPEGQKWEIGKEYVMHIEGDHPMVKRKVRVVVDPAKLKDRYEIVIAKFADRKVLNVQKIFSLIQDKQTGEILGNAISFAYWGGWIVNHSGLHVTATECPKMEVNPYKPSDHSTLLEKVFKPAKSSSERGN